MHVHDSVARRPGTADSFLQFLAFANVGQITPTYLVAIRCDIESMTRPLFAQAWPKLGLDARVSLCFLALAMALHGFSWLFSSRRQALTLLAHCTADFLMPNVRAKRATAVGHRAPAGENVRAPPAGARWPAVGAPLERGVRPQRAQLAGWRVGVRRKESNLRGKDSPLLIRR